jgi:hypothetical protein
MQLLINFLLTLVIELMIIILFLRKDYGFTIIYVLLINSFSWPLANLIYSYWQAFLIIEIIVFLVEGILIRLLFDLNWKKAFLLSFVANFVSASFGLLF